MAAPVGGEEEPGYVLAVAAETIRMADVVLAVQGCGDGADCGLALGQDAGVEGLFEELAQALRQSPANVSLAEFARPLAEELRARQDAPATAQ